MQTRLPLHIIFSEATCPIGMDLMISEQTSYECCLTLLLFLSVVSICIVSCRQASVLHISHTIFIHVFLEMLLMCNRNFPPGDKVSYFRLFLNTWHHTVLRNECCVCPFLGPTNTDKQQNDDNSVLITLIKTLLLFLE